MSDLQTEAKLEKLHELVSVFGRNIQVYKGSGYDESNTRTDFVDKFFELLDWDVRNTRGYAEAYRDVVREDKVVIEGKPKAPDYSFRIGGMRKFFVEAKKPSVNIKHDIGPSFQLRRYAYTARLPLSILTDFEEFAVFDTRIKPSQADRASTARIFYCTFDDYAANFEFISGTFSKEAVLSGSFDRYASDKKTKKGTSEVDKEFLKLIEEWRSALARSLALRNPSIDVYQLNEAVQTLIDRIIFLRIAEDRLMEPYGNLRRAVEAVEPADELRLLFKRANAKYNSGLFAEQSWISNLTIDLKALSAIIKGLYYPSCPYELSVLPIAILGEIYEQFLGKTIRLTAGHQAKIEEKPEVRRQGGVYYTPQYIVHYIVRNTVAKRISALKPDSIEELAFLDPACGSGSFLVEVYSCLLDHHLQHYSQPRNIKKALKSGSIYEVGPESYALSIREKQRILLNNIYGVDIDDQAVEVTRLSLLLKLMEDEHVEAYSELFKHSQLQLLPDLSSNIISGNSLVARDFFSDKSTSLLGSDEVRRLNPFEWREAFPSVFSRGGFDCVVGNPPYGFHQIHTDELKPYLKEKYPNATSGSFEHYFLFYEKSLSLLKEGGRHGFIVPVTWLTIPSAASLRRHILENFSVEQICWLPERVFEAADVNTLISILVAKKPTAKTKATILIYDKLGFQSPPATKRPMFQKSFVADGNTLNIFESLEERSIVNKISSISVPLSTVARPCSGYNPYEVGAGQAPSGGPHTKRTVQEKPYHSSTRVGSDWVPEVVGRELRRYAVHLTGTHWVKYGPWLAAPRKETNFTGPRILVQEITGGTSRRIIAAYYEEPLFHSRDVIAVKTENDFPDPRYILAILNSKLITFYHHKRNPKAQKGLFPKILVSDLTKIPLRLVPRESAGTHDRIVQLALEMEEAVQELARAKTLKDKRLAQQRTLIVDDQIDTEVYKLYGLSEEEAETVNALITNQ